MNASNLELRLPPPLVAVAVALLMWIASRFAEPLPFPGIARLIVPLGVAGLGLALGLTAILTFARAGTTVNQRCSDCRCSSST